MTAINPIGNSSLAASARQARQAQPKPAPAQTSAAQSALEEANETEATTRQEAAKGDQVAIRKLAREHKNHHPSQHATPPTSSSQGRGLNVKA